jgi:hypothetical protein
MSFLSGSSHLPSRIPGRRRTVRGGRVGSPEDGYCRGMESRREKNFSQLRCFIPASLMRVSRSCVCVCVCVSGLHLGAIDSGRRRADTPRPHPHKRGQEFGRSSGYFAVSMSAVSVGCPGSDVPSPMSLPPRGTTMPRGWCYTCRGFDGSSGRAPAVAEPAGSTHVRRDAVFWIAL